jgi:Flp pilus assembly protein TadD/DNA-binding beta-propeller fold protein YncE/transglutaminase-like putative cysteine protease
MNHGGTETRRMIENFRYLSVPRRLRGFCWPGLCLALLVFGSFTSVFGLEAVAIREYRVLSDADPRKPSRVALLGDGTLAIMDKSGRGVTLQRPNGARVPLACEPTGLAAFGLTLYIAEDERILRFDAEGRAQGVLADGDLLPFSAIAGLTVDERGNIYAADRGADVVFVIAPDGMPLTIIGENAEDAAELSGPVDVAVDGRGNVFIADWSNERIAIYSTGGVYKSQIPNIEEPIAVTCDAAGCVYVADADQSRVQRYDLSLQPRGAFGTRGRERGQFRELTDIDVASDGVLRVTDASNRSLHLLEWPSPEINAPRAVIPISARWGGVKDVEMRALGNAGSGRLALSSDEAVVLLDADGREAGRIAGFRQPSAAIADPSGRLYVADRGAGEVKVYDAALQELFSFGRGSRLIFFRGGPGKLVRPTGLAISAGGVMAIVDDGKVELFGPDGTYMSSVGASGDEPGQIEEPVGVAFDRAGNLFIADAENGTLQRFDASGSFSGKIVGKLEPLGLAADEEGRLYLLDDNGPRIRVYSPELELLGTIGVNGNGVGGLKGATAIACVRDRLYVSRSRGLASITLDLPLPAPSGVRLTPGMRSLEIRWDSYPVSFAEGFRVRCETIALRTSQSPARIDGLADEAEYRVRITAVNRLGREGYASETVAARTLSLSLAAPPAPSVTFEDGISSVRVKWRADSSPYVKAYAVEGQRGEVFERLALVEGDAVKLPASDVRRYRVRAVSDNGREGPASSEVAHAAAEGFDALSGGGMMAAVAAERFTVAVRQEPANARVWRGLGEAGERLERFSEAAAAYAKARELDPRDTSAALGLARLSLLRGDSAAAWDAIAAWPTESVRDAEYLYVRGQLSFARGEYDTAVRTLIEAVTLSPTARNRDALTKAEEARRAFGENRPRLEIVSARIDPIFPALYKTYGSQPIGWAVVRNGGNLPLERVRFSCFIRGAMDFPADTVIARLEPGETVLLPIQVELSNTILDATEDDTKQAELRLTYYRSGEPVEVRQTEKFRMYARTAITWSDPRRVAAFVTHRAPVVAEFARNVAGYASDLPDAGNAPLRTAMLLRHALREYGLRYQVDPASPFQRVSEDASAVDHVQLPEETLRNRAGDCDDLVVLLAALLENLGVRTMAVDVPGHLLLMVDAEVPPEAAALVADESDWFEQGGTVWVPIETTLLEGSFAEAVRAGAKAIATAEDRSAAGTPGRPAPDRMSGFSGAVTFVEIGAAWGTYPPVTTQSSDWRAALPERVRVLTPARSDDYSMRKRMAEALGAPYRVALESAGTEGADAALALGAIYGRLGLYDDAEEMLGRAGESAAALNNLGNIRLLKGDSAQARAYYERAAALDPDAGIQRNLERVR